MLSAITIDVDSLRFYMQIHGLKQAAPPLSEDPIYTVALPRFREHLEDLGLRATLFLIGEDAPSHAAQIRRFSDRGSEIASHSFTHDYRLTQKDEAEIADDLRSAHSALSPLSLGTPVVGFRAPGYNVSPKLLDAVLAMGYRYDSSLLPSPAYFALRAAAIGRYALSSQKSRSLVGDLRAFSGPLAPHRTVTASPWRKVAGGPLLELPIACAPVTRAPVIGTSWVLLPKAARKALLWSSLKGLEVFNFEMHAIDLLDAQDPGVPSSLVEVQPDLRVPISQKRAAFSELFSTLHQKTKVLPLREIADLYWQR